MKKQIKILVTFILALAVLFGVFTACDKKDEVSVTISKTVLTLETGKSSSLTASASDGSEIIWSTSDEEIVSVNEKGKVTGEKEGTATVTATVKDGKASASCEVTVKDPVSFEFKADGVVVTEISVDREESVQLSATASDGSAITSWSSGDSGIATVSSTGLVTGVYDGETEITVKTETGKGSIKVTVADTFQGEKYTLTDAAEGQKAPGKWWYYIALDGTRETKEVRIAEYRGGTVSFDFSADNWYTNDVQLGMLKATDAAGGWRKLTGKINSSVAGSVTILGTVVTLKEGDNAFTVCYNQDENDNQFYMAFDATGLGFISTAKVVVSDLVWSEHTVVDLATPSLALSGDKVTVTDTANTEGVESYQIGLFKNAEDTTPAFTQNFTKEGGDIDASTFAQNGTYIVKIRALGKLGYSHSGWSTATNITYVVNNGSISYQLENTGESAASANPGTWTYWAGDGGSVDGAPTYENGTINLKCTLGWAWYSVQLFYRSSTYTNGTALKVTMKVNSSAEGYMTISGQVVKINEGDNDIDITITQGTGATLSIQFGVDGHVDTADTPNPGYFPTYTETPLTFVISDVVIAEAPAA